MVKKRLIKKTARKSKLQKKDVYYLVFVVGWTTLSLIASQFIVYLLMAFFLGDKFTESFWTLLYYILTNALTLALIIWVSPRLFNLWHNHRHHQHLSLESKNEFSVSKEEMGVTRWPNFIDIGLAPIGYLIYVFASNLLTQLMTAIFPWFDAEQSQATGFGYFVTAGDRIMAMIAIVFVAPIAEELIMRGWLYGKVRSKLGAISTILIVSLVFAVLHGQWNVSVAVFVLSLVLCGLREITGSVWSGMLLHILSNGIAFYLLYIALIQ